MTVIAQRKDIFVGRIRDLDTNRVTGRVFVDIELREKQSVSPHETTDHHPVDSYTELSITGTVYYPNGGPGGMYERIQSCGQTINDLFEVNDLTGSALDLVKLRWLRKVWKRWHLNGLTAGCDHQTPVMERDQYGRTVPSLDKTPPCPVTGYRYGHAWLVKELPVDLVNELVETFRLQ